MQTTVKDKELEKFGNIAEQWWDKNGSFAALHKINPSRIKYITQIIYTYLGKNHNQQDICETNINQQDPHKTSILDTSVLDTSILDTSISGASISGASISGASISDVNILDVGCGGGITSFPLARLGYKMTAIDANEKNIKIAEIYGKQKNINVDLYTSTIEDFYKLKQDKYDIILALEVIEHVNDVEFFLKSLIKFLKPNGIIIISTINKTLKSIILAKIMAEYILRIIPFGTHDPNCFIKPSLIKDIYRDQLKTIDLSGLSFNPLTAKWFLSEDINVNYFLSLQNY